MHLFWKQDFPIEINKKFCLKKDKSSVFSDHVFHDVQAAINIVLKWVEICTEKKTSGLHKQLHGQKFCILKEASFNRTKCF